MLNTAHPFGIIRGGQINYYIYEEPPGQVGQRKPQTWFERFLRSILPPGNPDFEGKFDKVQTWWLETDDDWEVHREIGFDSLKVPIVAAPLGENHGIFADHVGGVPLRVDGAISQADFERVWNEFTKDWQRKPR